MNLGWTFAFCFVFALAKISSSADVVKAIDDEWFPLSIIHINDLHAR